MGDLPANRDIGAKLQDEVLNGEILYNLKEPEVLIERWRRSTRFSA